MASRLVGHHHQRYVPWAKLLDRQGIWLESRRCRWVRRDRGSQQSSSADTKPAQRAHDPVGARRSAWRRTVVARAHILGRHDAARDAGRSRPRTQAMGRPLPVRYLLRDIDHHQRDVRRHARRAHAGHLVLVPVWLRHRIGDGLSRSGRWRNSELRSMMAWIRRLSARRTLIGALVLCSLLIVAEAAIFRRQRVILSTRCDRRRARRLDPGGGRFRRRRCRVLPEEWNSQSAGGPAAAEAALLRGGPYRPERQPAAGRFQA